MSFLPFYDSSSKANLVHSFGIELAPEVVQADGNVRNLAWRVCNAKRVLVCNFSLFIYIRGEANIHFSTGPLQHVEKRCHNPD